MGSVEVIDLSSDDESEKVRDLVPVKLEPGVVKQHRRIAKCEKSQSRATGKDVEENFSGSVPSTGHSNSSVLEQGPSPIDDTGISYASPLCAAPLSRQFWKAGSYDDGHASQIAVKDGKNYLHVHPMFLHSNATSHKWAFGAIAELLDNAVDEIQNGATFVSVDKTSNPRDGSPALLIQDDGGGMDPEAMRRCMSFGFSDKNSKLSIGQYGNGFKTSSMRLGADAIVFSRHLNNGILTQSIGLLSYTFLTQTQLDRIVVPMVNYEFNTSTGSLDMLNGKEHFKANLSLLLRWSPYSSEADLLKQFDNMGSHGTKVIVYNLWLNDEGITELNFDTDPKDICIAWDIKKIGKKPAWKRIQEEHIANRFRYSLRVYLSILYLRLPQTFQIILRGQAVKPHSIADDLKLVEFVKYTPQCGGGAVEELFVTIGFLKEAPHVNIHGFNVYHKHRLILPFCTFLQTFINSLIQISDIPQISSTFIIMNPLDTTEFKKQGHMIIDFLADYYENISNYPVLSQVEPNYLKKLLPSFAPSNPEPIETILEDYQKHIIPGITHWQSPNYFAYFPSSGSTAGFLGEMLSTGLNVVGFNWISSPAATELENVVIDWLGEILNLPKSFLFKGGGGGVLLGTTCEGILGTLVVARDKILSKIGSENVGKLVVYGSDQTHCAVQKAAHIIGIDPKNFRAIKTDKLNSFTLLPESLLSTIQNDLKNGLVPCFLCVTVGTTSTTAIDPVGKLCNVAKDYGIWVHVDAAYAGSACICPEFRYLIDGVEDADSFSLNAHKWFLTNLDCCCLWLKDPNSLIKCLSTTNSEYLENSASDSKQVVDYKDWQVTLSRRFRALKVWFVLRSYGVDNLRNFLRNHVEMAKTFEGLVKMDKRFEIVVPRKLSLVCFRILPYGKKVANGKVTNGDVKLISNEDVIVANGKVTNGEAKLISSEDVIANEINRKLLDSINGSGDVYMTHAVVEGVFVIRCAVGATLTEEMHVIRAWKVVQEHADAILKDKKSCIFV